MNRLFCIIVSFILLSPLCWAGGKKEGGAQPQQPQAVPLWTGDGGRGTSLAILAPKSTGLAENQSYLPLLVQGEFVSNFSGYSAISVMDRENLEKVYAELLSGYYSDDDAAGLDLGHLTATDYLLTGNITRTATGYALQIQVTKTADKMTTASYSGTCTFAELDNLTGIRKASLDLLQKMGVTLTAQAQGTLIGAAVENHVNAQTALARGITAQRQGTEVAALSYYFQAASYDPSLMEAANRSSILNANISGGNIGSDVRNDIAWRRDWVARLTETEQFFDSFNRTESMPYTLFYVSDEIKQGAVNYQNETVNLSTEAHLHGSGIWTLSIERALQAVYDGLDATKRKDTWGLGNWPRQGVTNLNAFARRSGNFSVVFELLNDQNKIIGRQTLQTSGSWNLNGSGRPVAQVNADDRKPINFQNVNANDITDRMTLRIATVNGTDAETAARNGVLQMRAITRAEFDRNSNSNRNFRFVKGEIQGFANNRVADLVIPDTIWGDPVIRIGRDAFKDNRLTRVSIGSYVNTIGDRAFYGNHLTSVILPNSVTSVGNEAFADNVVGNRGLSDITIPNNATFIGTDAFQWVQKVSFHNGVTFIGATAFPGQGSMYVVIIPDSVRSIDRNAFQGTFFLYICIGANVEMSGDPFQGSLSSGGRNMAYNNGFLDFYTRNGGKAGTYTTMGFGPAARWRYHRELPDHVARLF